MAATKALSDSTSALHQNFFATRPPLLNLDIGCYLTKLRKKVILQWIESGRIGYAWNIGRGSFHREIRIWRGSIAALLASELRDGGAAIAEDRVIGDILPQRDIWSYELRRFIMVTPSHVTRLISNGFLRVKTVRDQASKIDHASLIAFFKSRRVT